MAETLSIIIPAYNEERYIGTLLEQILAVDLSRFGVAKEIIVVDDGSSDRTADIARRFDGVIVHSKPNGGKGSAVNAGLRLARGQYILIQDADLEYDPNDYRPMLAALLDRRSDAVYGSRYMDPQGGSGPLAWIRMKHPRQSWAAYLGGRSLSLVALPFTGRYLTDTVTALKMFRRDVVVHLPLETTGFELDHEITSRILARGHRIEEVPIQYHPRTREEGKKIGLRDWFRGVRTFYNYRRG
jgi:glycosyltransferase involved in cell wall biosynthesis